MKKKISSEINFWRVGDPKPERKRTGIHAAIASNDLAQVHEWLDIGVDIEQPDYYGDRPLSLAAAFGNAEIVALLLKNGAHPDLYSLSLPPLAEAMYRGHFNVMQTLIAATADVNVTLWEGDSLLMIAVGMGNAELVSLLIEAGAQVNAANQDGDTALIIAARCGHLNITQILIDAGADVDAMNRYCYTALLSAAENGFLPLCEYLNAVVEQQIAAISEALKYGDAGWDLIVQAFKERAGSVMWAAYSLLQQRTELGIKQTLWTYHPYRLVECFHTLSGHSREVNSVAISPNGQTVVSGSSDSTIKVWNLKTGQEICTLAGHSGSVRSVAITSDGQTVISGSHDKTIRLWDLNTGQEICTLKGHSAWVNSIAITPDGQTVISSSHDKTIRLWNTKTKRESGILSKDSGLVLAVVQILIDAKKNLNPHSAPALVRGIRRQSLTNSVPRQSLGTRKKFPITYHRPFI